MWNLKVILGYLNKSHLRWNFVGGLGLIRFLVPLALHSQNHVVRESEKWRSLRFFHTSEFLKILQNYLIILVAALIEQLSISPKTNIFKFSKIAHFWMKLSRYWEWSPWLDGCRKSSINSNTDFRWRIRLKKSKYSGMFQIMNYKQVKCGPW